MGFRIVFSYLLLVLGLSTLAQTHEGHNSQTAYISPVLEKQTASLFALFDTGVVTRQAVSSGSWSAAATWRGGLPAEGDRVYIPEGVTVTVDTELVPALKTLRVDGTLDFATNTNTSLRVETMLVNTDGSLIVGTPENFVQPDVKAEVIFADLGGFDHSSDPFTFGRGLISMGTVSIHGAETTAFVALSGVPKKGASELKLSEVPVNWKVGDEVVLAGTNTSADQDEKRTILSIDSDKKTITVDPLEFARSVPEPDLSVHLAHLSRNIVFRSENATLANRGHVMFMHPESVSVYYAGFYDLGRTNKLEALDSTQLNEDGSIKEGTGINQLGRYALHFHRGGINKNDQPFVAVGNVVENSPGWGFVNHSSYVNFSDNVAYNVTGAGFVTEVGNELGTFHHNIAIRSLGSGLNERARFRNQDFGHEGNGFWFQGSGGIDVTDNVASGASGNGFAFYNEGLIEFDLHPGLVLKSNGRKAIDSETLYLTENLDDPTIAVGEPAIRVSHAPVSGVSGNMAYASETGALLRSELPLDNQPNQTSLYENFTFWSNNTGVIATYIAHTTLRNFRVIGNVQRPTGTGVRGNSVGSAFNADLTYDNLHIVGFERGLILPTRGAHPYDFEGQISQVQVIGGYFNNIENIVATNHNRTPRETLITGDIRFGTLSEEALDGRKQYRIVMEPSFKLPKNMRAEEGVSSYFLSDQLILNFDEFHGHRVYFNEQEPSFVPFPEAGKLIQPEYVGKTNQQLFDEFGLALAGSLLPENVMEVADILGKVMEPSDQAQSNP